jgi:hypothetical protein
MGLFCYDSILELSPKNLGNSPSFLSVPHNALFAKFLKIDLEVTD